MSNKKDLKAFVRYDGSGRVVAGSLILRKRKPKVGKWGEVPTYKGADTPTIVDTAVAVEGSTLATPVCSGEGVSLTIYVPEGTTFETAEVFYADQEFTTFANDGNYVREGDYTLARAWDGVSITDVDCDEYTTTTTTTGTPTTTTTTTGTPTTTTTTTGN